MNRALWLVGFAVFYAACAIPDDERPRRRNNLAPTSDDDPTSPPFPTDDDSTDTLPIDSGGWPTEFGVDVFWTANYPRSAVSVRIHDPEGRQDWRFGMAETEAGSVGWFGEDCFFGTADIQLCHPIEGRRLDLDQGPFADLEAGTRTLLWSDMDLTYFLEDDQGACWVWGHDPSYYDGLGCEHLDNHRTAWVRRQGCGGFSPADPAPLGRRVALTFDDGPHPTVTPAILDTLREAGIPATFFVVGENVDAYPWIVQDILDDPLFEVGNHSFRHPNLAELDDDDALDEVDDTHQALLDQGAMPRFFRFPYGATHCRLADRVRDGWGYRIAGWHADTADWCFASGGTCPPSEYYRVPAAYASDMRGFTVAQLERFEGGVVLLHDIHNRTADELPALIADLTAAGFTFAALDDLAVFPRLNQDDPYDFAWIGESCDPSDDPCFQVEWRSVCQPTSGGHGVCVLPCDRDAHCADRDGGAPLRCVDAGSGGACLAEATGVNDDCADIPGTYPESRNALSSSDGPGARVCVPGGW